MVERAKRGKLGLHPSSKGIFSGFRRAALLAFVVSVPLLVAVTALACDCSDYVITFLGSTFDGTNTTFQYEVTANYWTDVTHWVLGLGSCAACDDVVSATASSGESGSCGSDPTTGIFGIKFDVTVERGHPKQFWITFSGYWPEEPVPAGLKAGQLVCNSYTVIGPGCPQRYALSMAVSPAGAGTTDPAVGTHTYDYGDVVPIDATPATGWQFHHWEGDVTGSSNPDTVTMTGDKSVTAVFTKIGVTLTMAVSPAGAGTTDPAVGTHTYDYGDVVPIEATPATGWQFHHWEGDVTGSSNPDTVTMDEDKNVTAVFTEEDHPVDAVDDPYSTAEDMPLNVPVPGVMTNDSAPDGGESVVLVSDVSHGTLSLNPNGSFTYIPDPQFNGTDSFDYELSDGDGDTDEATVTIEVAAGGGGGVNEPPIANDDTALTGEGVPVDIYVILNDGDPDGMIDPDTVLIIDDPISGSANFFGDGTVTYTPDAAFNGIDSFTYTVDDNEGETSNIATVTVFVTAKLADLSLEKTVNNASPYEGDDVAYTLLLTNNGPDDATGVEVIDVLLPGVRYAFNNGDGAYDSVTGVWRVGTLAVGASAALEITVTVDAGTAETTIPNTAQVSNVDQDDPGDTNNSDSVDITVQAQESVAVGGGGVAEDSCEGKVIISEIAWSGTAADPWGEWIELRNLGTTPVDLTDWTLRWRRKHPSTQEESRWKVLKLSGMLMSAPISACELAEREPTPSVSIVKNDTDEASWLILGELEEKDDSYYLLERWHDATVSNVTADLVYDTEPPYDLELSDSGDMIILVNGQGEIADTANAFESEHDGWPAGNATTFATMERTDPLGPDTKENWHTNLGIMTYGLDALRRPLVASSRVVNSTVLDELAVVADLPPTEYQAGTYLEVGIEVPANVRKTPGWPGVHVTSPDFTEPIGGGGAIDYGASYSFYGYYEKDTYWLGIDTDGLPPGQYSFWIPYGEGKTMIVPITVVPWYKHCNRFAAPVFPKPGPPSSF